MEPSKSYNLSGEDQSSGWDSHGVGPNMTLQLNNLSSMKKYKVSNIYFLKLATRSVEALFGDDIGLHPGGIYTKSQLTHILHSTPSSYFQKMQFVVKTNPDGTVDLNIPYKERDDIDFNLNYTHPYLDGIDNPRRNRTFRATCFNTRKLSPVFRVAATADDSPIWVDTKGIKATITEEYTKQSKLTYGLVVEDIKTRDKGGNIAARGPRDGRLFRGNGPPTTLSGTGNDQLAFLQANLTRDNTRFVNGALVGARDVFQVDQGMGIGTKFTFFNRAKVSATRFIPLWKVNEGKGNAAPPVLVLHGLYGNCVGDLPNHEAFTIGGPHSVRYYNIGEIGASRSKLEVAAEIHIPVKNAATVYGFAEHGNDMGTSDGLTYMRKGRGSSWPWNQVWSSASRIRR